MLVTLRGSSTLPTSIRLEGLLQILTFWCINKSIFFQLIMGTFPAQGCASWNCSSIFVNGPTYALVYYMTIELFVMYLKDYMEEGDHPRTPCTGHYMNFSCFHGFLYPWKLDWIELETRLAPIISDLKPWRLKNNHNSAYLKESPSHELTNYRPVGLTFIDCKSMEIFNSIQFYWTYSST